MASVLGKWKLEHSEMFEEYMAAIGMLYMHIYVLIVYMFLYNVCWHKRIIFCISKSNLCDIVSGSNDVTYTTCKQYCFKMRHTI